MNRRFTVTRIAALGVLAAGLPKRIDDRELYISIEGPKTVIVHAIPVRKNKTLPADARRFVAKLNQMSGAIAEPAAAPASTPAPAPAVLNAIDNELTKKLEELASLHASGIISDAEFASKRAELIARF